MCSSRRRYLTHGGGQKLKKKLDMLEIVGEFASVVEKFRGHPSGSKKSVLTTRPLCGACWPFPAHEIVIRS